MTTPRIEEMAKSLGHKIEYIVSNRDEYPDTQKEVDKVIIEALTEAHQAGIEEAVEIVKQQLTALSWSAENETPDAIRIIAAIYDTIKALQDNK